ncbi:hypothetical protein E3T54_15915 [Cryobacterium sp. Sr8]|nr:hypothetical protein E3T54_15915 [Cryobacterium sp. Sr8]
MNRSASKFTMVGLMVSGILFAGTACASNQSGADSAAGPAGDVAPSSSPGPEVDPLTSVTTIVVRPEALELMDESGSLVASLTYEDPLAAMLSALSVVVGEEPATASYEGGLERPAGQTYSWAGLTLTDYLPPEGKFLGESDYSLDFTAGQVGDGVAITTESGSTVGDDMDAVADELGLSVNRDFASAGHLFFLIEVGPELTTPAGDNIEYPNAWAVHVSSTSGSGVINNIGAPVNLSHWVS